MLFLRLLVTARIERKQAGSYSKSSSYRSMVHFAVKSRAKAKLRVKQPNPSKLHVNFARHA